MADSMKDKIGQVGQKITDTVKDVSHKISEGAEKMAHFAKEKLGTSGCGQIREHMDVIASCGTKVGVVDHVEGDSIKLTKKDSPDGQHHLIPKDWVDHVDTHVHLKKNSMETKADWQPA
jgi:hypothetical protein